MKRVLKYIPYLILVLALGLLYRELNHLRWDQLAHTLTSYSSTQVLFALSLLTLNYTVWSLYDWVSLRQLGLSIPYVQIFRTCAIAFPITNLVGYSLITGLAIRIKCYKPYGVSLGQVTQLIFFNVESWWAGFFFVCGAAIVHSPIQGRLFELSARGSRYAGIALLSGVALYLFTCWRAGGRIIRLRATQIFLPDLMSGSMKVLVAALDNIIVMLTMYAVLPGPHTIPVERFAAFFFAAQLVALLSFVPAGLGVMEGVMLFLLRPYASDAEILASLVMFRLIHFLLPVSTAVVIELIPKLLVRARSYGH